MKTLLLKNLFEDIACTICGCVCDDLRVTVEEDCVTRADGACKLAEPWFLRQTSFAESGCSVRGRPAPIETGIAEAGRLLQAAHAPLIYGLSRSSTDGQRAAVALADRIGAIIDTTASRCHAPSIMALQQVGESTCSLGEVKNRSDLVIYWGANPVDSHPRHLERYAYDPPGLFVPRGSQDRHLVVIDTERTPTADLADTFLQVQPNSDFELIWSLREVIRQLDSPDETALGHADERLVSLARRMKHCRSGVVFFGMGLTRHSLGHLTVEALLRLVTDLNDYTRFYARRMRIPGDVSGADSVLCWQTGYPFSVDFSRGYPRYNPGEFSANEVLERGEVDLCLMVGSEGIDALSPLAVEFLRQIPLIVLDYPGVESPIAPTVRFTTPVYGMHVPGTAYRMDEVPIPLRTVFSSNAPTDADVLKALQ